MQPGIDRGPYFPRSVSLEKLCAVCSNEEGCRPLSHCVYLIYDDEFTVWSNFEDQQGGISECRYVNRMRGR